MFKQKKVLKHFMEDPNDVFGNIQFCHRDF